MLPQLMRPLQGAAKPDGAQGAGPFKVLKALSVWLSGPPVSFSRFKAGASCRLEAALPEVMITSCFKSKGLQGNSPEPSSAQKAGRRDLPLENRFAFNRVPANVRGILEAE